VFGLAPQRASLLAARDDAPAVVATDAVRALTRGRLAFAACGTGAPGQDGAAALFEPIGPAGGPIGGATSAPAGDFAAEGAGDFVGRESEIESLAAACAEAEAGDGRLVAVMGEPGVGKSRLVREFVARRLPRGWRAAVTGADPQFVESAYHPIRRLLAGFFGDGGGPAGATGTEATRVETTLARLGLLGSAVAAPLRALLDLDPRSSSPARGGGG
jgi:hypothetical protein